MKGSLGAGPQVAAGQGDLPPFSSIRGVALLVSGALLLTIVMDVVGIISGLAEVRLVTRVINGESVTVEELERNDNRQALVGALQLGVFILTAILFLVWIFRAYRNLRSFKAVGLEYSPRWAVGGFFVPFLNWWRPYQVMCEICRASDPDVNDPDPRAWQSAPVSPLVKFWWVFWLIGGFVGGFILRATFPEPDDINEFRTLSQAIVAADAIEIPAAILAILVVWYITTRQEERNHVVQAGRLS